MKIYRKILQINENLCDGCGQCIPSCAEGALQIIDGKAKLIADKYCDGLGACLGDCPKGALKIIEREAEDFDEMAVEEHLNQLKKYEFQKEKLQESLPCGCPSTKIEHFTPSSLLKQGYQPATQEPSPSALSHWPVQIRLVPPGAPFLKNAHIIVAADCTPIAYADFHRDFIKDKVVMIGCPKFDDVQGYMDKFVEIFRKANIQSITSVVMEVPCCSGLPVIVKKALAFSGKTIPIEEVVISTRGDIIRREKTASPY